MIGRLKRDLLTPFGRAADRWLDRWLAAGALGVCAATGLALLARMSWLLELLAHFRLQYLVSLVAIAALFVARRRWYKAAALLPFAIVNAIAVAPYWPRGPASEPSVGPSIELMSVNLHARNNDHERFLELVRQVSPDLIVLLEVDPGWARALGDLAEDYPQRVLLPRGGPYGIAVLSRLSLLDHRTFDLAGTPAVEARIALPGGRDLDLIGVHLRSPTTSGRSAQRNAQLAALRPLVAAQAGPLIVAGDFNATPYSPFMSDWLEQTGLHDPRRGRGFAMTWPVFMPILGVPIDHCLLSEHFVVVEQYQGPAFGSDHYPVITRIGLRGNE